MKIGIIGLGYVGLSTACLFSTRHEVVGYDQSERRVSQIKDGKDKNLMLSADELSRAMAGGMTVTTDSEALRCCEVYIVMVPTPVNADHLPDTTCLEQASAVVGKYISRGGIVIYESTVYPGATEEICVPIVERVSGLKYNTDFFAGYSPERINPGDSEHKLENVMKITSGSTPETARMVDDLYNSVLRNGTYPAPSIKVAEAAKVMENSQRDMNIAFMNEMAVIFHALGIDTKEVIDAASTKWNFQRFLPGLVGGHCIGVDPYYLIKKAKEAGVEAGLLSKARRVNEHIGVYVAERVLSLMGESGTDPASASVLVLGFTFKENCPDCRNTKVLTIIDSLRDHVRGITVYDPWVEPDVAAGKYGFKIVTDFSGIRGNRYDAIILCVRHDAFGGIDITRLENPNCVVFDVKGALDKRLVTERL